MGCKNCETICQCTAQKCGSNCACHEDCQCVCKKGPKEECCSSK